MKKNSIPFLGKFFDVAEKARAEENSKTPFEKDVKITSNVVYKTVNDENLYIDIYEPSVNHSNPLPAVLVIPGGGWMVKNRTRRKGYASLLAYLGVKVFVIDYRVTPYVRFPENLKDVIDALNYISDRKDEFNIDVNNVVITGDSAGGHLTACLACVCTTPGYADKLNLYKPSVTPVGCMFISGSFSLDAMNGRIPCTHFLLSRHFSGFRTKTGFKKWALHNEAHPWNCITENFPPSFNSGGKTDVFCKGDAVTMANKLSEKNVKNKVFVGTSRHCDHCYIYRLPYLWARQDMYKLLAWYAELEQTLNVDMSEQLEKEAEFLMH